MRLKTERANINNLATSTAVSKITNVSKRLKTTQTLVKLKIQFLMILIMINILLLNNLIS